MSKALGLDTSANSRPAMFFHNTVHNGENEFFFNGEYYAEYNAINDSFSTCSLEM